MSKPKNNGKKWTVAEEKRLVSSNKKEMTTREIAKDLERTPQAIRSKLDRLNKSAKPKDKAGT